MKNLPASSKNSINLRPGNIYWIFGQLKLSTLLPNSIVLGNFKQGLSAFLASPLLLPFSKLDVCCIVNFIWY